jgi:2-methylcitrate dehydratase PrpD
MTALEQLGAFVARSGAPSPRLRENLELHVVDIVGAWISSPRTAEGAALLRWRDTLREDALGPGRSAGVPPALHKSVRAGSSALGPAPGSIQGLRFDVATHCALARMSEIDDIHLSSMTTPGAIVIPGAITLAAGFGSRDPAALAAAMMAGYEVMIRLGKAIDGASILYRGIWPTYFAAPAGLAAVAARLLDLDAGEVAHALALALTRASPGVGQHHAATTSRWLAVGQAAEAGLLAALAARAGFTCDLGLLDDGFLPGIYDVKPDAAVLTAALGERFSLPDVSFKPWCAARQTMAATAAVIEIVGSGVSPDAITRMTAFVPPPHRRMIDHGVTAGDRASFLTSLPYRMAVAALAPQAAFDIAQAPAQVPEPIRAFMARIAIEPDDALMSNYPQDWPARVEVATSSGRHVRTVTHVPGDPARPYHAAAVQEKFRRFAEPAIGAAPAALLLEHALGLLNGQTSCAQLLQDIEHACAASLGDTQN